MLKLYGFLYSPPSRACYTFLKMFEDMAPFEFVSVNAWEQENETEKFRNMNPLGTIPVLKEDGGLTLAQSHAILRYVSKTRFDCKMFEPENEATINECLDWQLLRLRPTIATVLRFDRIRGSSLVDAPSVSVQSLVGKADGTDPRDVVRTTFDIVEDMLERRGGFLTGSEPSIADISASCEVEQFALEHESLVNEYSGMKKWLKYFRSIEAYNEAHHGLRRQHDKIVDKSAKGSFVKALRGGAIDT